MSRILTYNEIDRAEWNRLVWESETGTWFQSPEAYDFFASMPDLFRPFAIAVANDANDENGEMVLRGVCVGYVTKEKGLIKQYFTRRAIIIGGPALADDCTDEEVQILMEAVRKVASLQQYSTDGHRQSDRAKLFTLEGRRVTTPKRSNTGCFLNGFNTLLLGRDGVGFHTIYIETRNFNDYSKWRTAFEKAGFEYKKHLNFHVDCSEKEAMWEKLSENRRRQLRRSDAEIIIIGGKTKTRHQQSLDSDIPETTPRSACMQASGQSEDLYRAAGEQQDASQKHAIAHKNPKNIEDIQEWYGILEKLYRTKVKMPLWPVEFFLEAYRQGIGRFMLVKYENKVIGGSMVVTDGRSVYEWFECGMNAKYKEQYPSVMATWAGMALAHETGCARYDMMGAGEPDVPYGVRDFKSEFGGELVEHGRFLCVNKPLLYKIGTFGVKILKRK